MSRISVILATFNEERNIKDCLDSVRQLADEIIIVDGSSTDRTVEIAKKYTDKIFIRENPPMFHINKQMAIDKATGDWILYLDADERVTPELRAEILQLTKDPASPAGRQKPETKDYFSGYWIPRKNIIFGKWIEHSGWWPDNQLRLFRRGKAYLPCKSVHEQPALTGEAGYLKTPLVHYNYQTVWQFVNKLNNLYTENDKTLLLKGGKKTTWYDAIRLPSNEFFKRFFLEEGYKDGLHGLTLSIFQSFSSFVTWAKLWETQGFKSEEGKDILDKVNNETKRLKKDFHWWFLTAKISQVTSLWEKLFLKIRRKVSL